MRWPWWVKLMHWLNAVGVIGLWIQGELLRETGGWHRWIGYWVVLLISIRVLAGIMTNHQSAQFYWPTMQSLKQYGRAVYRRQAKASIGHNPFGQLAVYLIWSLILLLAISGCLSRTDYLWGEDWPIYMHRVCSHWLMCLVALHLLGVLIMSYITQENLVLKMLFSWNKKNNIENHERCTKFK